LQKYKVGHHASFGSRWMLHVGDIWSVNNLEWRCYRM